jgi:hypothetical protein
MEWYVPPKHGAVVEVLGVRNPKTVLFLFTAVRISNPALN